MIAVTVANRKAVAVPLSDVTTGAVGIPVSFQFSSDWDGLSKIAVFKAGDVTPVEMAILLNATTVPHEVLVNAYDTLWIGIYGSDAQGTVVIPTVWANAGAIQPGTELETIDPSEPTPSWVAQVQAAAETALEIAQGVQQAAEDGDFDGADGQDGQDGVSPTVSVSSITGGHTVTITDADGNHSFNVMDGSDGQNGSNGKDGKDGKDGVDGQDGEDGVSPTVSVTSSSGSHVITITDADGDHSFTVYDGEDGQQGEQGEQGETGPAGNGVADFHSYGTGTSGGKTYTDYVFEFDNGDEETIRVFDGEKGDTGAAGQDGQDGEDGITPTVTVTEIAGGHNVAFDYGTGDQRNTDFDVMDGEVSEDDLEEALLAKADVIKDVAKGRIVTFPDGMAAPMKIEATLEPVQDLHGYENPWPGGGGKNKAEITAETIVKPSWYNGNWLGTSLNSNNGITQERGYQQGGAGGFSVSLVPGTYTASLTFTGTTTACIFHAGSWDGTNAINLVNNETMTKNGTRYSYTFTVPDGSQQVEIRPTIYTATEAYNLDDIQIESGSSVTSFQPYSNICPISGHSGAVVNVTGENLFDPSNGIQDKLLGRGTGSLSANTSYMVSNFMPVEPLKSYHYGDFNIWYHTLYDANMNILSGTLGSTNANSITIPNSNARYIRISCEKTKQNTAYFSETASSYEPYQGSSVTLTFGSTVYGGTLTVNEDGSKNVEVQKAAFTFSNETWTYHSSGFFYRSLLPANTAKDGDYTTENGINLHVYNNTGQARIYLQFNPTLSASSNLTEILNGYKFVYPLATQQEIPLSDDTPIEALLGNNTVWVDDATSVTVTYPADTKLYIEKLTQPTEDDMVANANIPSGKFFMVGNNLYYSTQSIANGAAIVPGTNCTRLSLADALNNLNS